MQPTPSHEQLNAGAGMQEGAADVQLWNRVRLHEQEALVTLYERLYFYLLNYGARTCGDVERTRDAINDVFLELWDRRLKLPDVSNVKSYLLTYLRRKIFANMKEEQMSSEAAGRLSETSDAYEFSYEDCIVALQASDEVKAKIKRAMALLTPRQKELVQLRFFDGLSMEDTGKRAGISTKTAYNTLAAALKTLSAGLMAALFYYWLMR
ncbi:RNA polymerase sigma factor [Chitinophaga lutea]|uniref:RNA polymerase sigma factor n=1 Tax=Chitinophaga lutea TaxID=2488634 RepID=UPI001315198E|nr:sigma-70 family RNA polymerase sigma factor [Chitinophaga lutea]